MKHLLTRKIKYVKNDVQAYCNCVSCLGTCQGCYNSCATGCGGCSSVCVGCTGSCNTTCKGTCYSQSY